MSTSEIRPELYPPKIPAELDSNLADAYKLKIEDAKVRIEYVKLWMQQSQLFWSRLQTATALNTGVLVGWYSLKKEHFILCSALLLLGIGLNFVLGLIMKRDAVCMDSMRKYADRGLDEGSVFPQTTCMKGWGRICGMAIIAMFVIAESILLTAPVFLHMARCIR